MGFFNINLMRLVMSNNAVRKFAKGKIQIIFIGGGTGLNTDISVSCDCTIPTNANVVIGYSKNCDQYLSPDLVDAVVILNTNISHIDGLEKLYNAHNAGNLLELVIAPTLVPNLWLQLVYLFGWQGDLNNYFDVTTI